MAPDVTPLPDPAEVVEVVPGIFRHRIEDLVVYTLDADNTAELQEKIREILAGDSPEALAIHVRRSRHLNSRFVGLLIFLYKAMLDEGRRYVLLNPSLRMRDLILVMTLHDECEMATRVIDLPPERDGLLVTGPKRTPSGLDRYQVGDWRILSATQRLDLEALAEFIREGGVVETPLAIHIGEVEADWSQVACLLVGLAVSRRNQGRSFALLNPNLHLHDELRRNRCEGELMIACSLTELGDRPA